MRQCGREFHRLVALFDVFGEGFAWCASPPPADDSSVEAGANGLDAVISVSFCALERLGDEIRIFPGQGAWCVVEDGADRSNLLWIARLEGRLTVS
jgi:hypothetical protein